MSCGVDCRHGSDPVLLWLWLLWLWHRLAATALIRPLAWEPSYGMGESLEKTKKKNKKMIGTENTLVLLRIRTDCEETLGAFGADAL